jgi:hypothetical protein
MEHCWRDKVPCSSIVFAKPSNPVGCYPYTGETYYEIFFNRLSATEIGAWLDRHVGVLHKDYIQLREAFLQLASTTNHNIFEVRGFKPLVLQRHVERLMSFSLDTKTLDFSLKQRHVPGSTYLGSASRESVQVLRNSAGNVSRLPRSSFRIGSLRNIS